MLQKNALVKKALASLHTDLATITTYPDEVMDPDTGIVGTGEQASGEYPCRLSYKSVRAADRGDGIASFEQSVTLFIAPDIEIAAGSDIDVKHQGQTLRFNASGVPAVYASHQEVPLKHRDKYDG